MYGCVRSLVQPTAQGVKRWQLKGSSKGKSGEVNSQRSKPSDRAPCRAQWSHRGEDVYGWARMWLFACEWHIVCSDGATHTHVR